MENSFFLLLAVPLCGGALLSFLVERQLQPKPNPLWRRPKAALLIHLGIFIVLFSIEFALFRRPYFAAVNVLALLLFILLINNAKYQALREPFVFQDFDYFTDALKYPRLYIPFLGLNRALVAVVAVGGAIVAGITLETPLTYRVPFDTVLIVTLFLFIVGMVLTCLGCRHGPAVTLDLEMDITQLGFLASVCLYGVEEHRSIITVEASVFASPAVPSIGNRPDLVVVQSESFFDVRRWFEGVRPEVLQRFDQLRKESFRHGLLDVPAWGANTVRSEFAFLAGLGTDTLGVHRFNPYRHFALQGVPTLAGFLKKLGYRTICVHPYPAGFYSRDKVFPLLGIDEFIDLRSLSGVEKSGPYVGDVALAEKACSLLETHTRYAQPVFLFVITMENHGPLHLERIESHEIMHYCTDLLPAGCDDLAVYLRHLVNADRMVGKLREYLKSSAANTWFCFFGDHVPIMPKVYETIGTPDRKTNYVIWNNRNKGRTPDAMLAHDVRIENLGALLLRNMGLLEASACSAKRDSRPPQGTA